MSTTTYKKRAGLNATAYSHLIAALMQGGKTKGELEQETGMGPSLVARCIKALKDRGVIYVSGWRPDGRGRMTLREYTLGRGKDEACPKMTRAEIVSRWLERRKRKGPDLARLERHLTRQGYNLDELDKDNPYTQHIGAIE